jgi:hypothetical protein
MQDIDIDQGANPTALQFGHLVPFDQFHIDLGAETRRCRGIDQALAIDFNVPHQAVFCAWSGSSTSKYSQFAICVLRLLVLATFKVYRVSGMSFHPHRVTLTSVIFMTTTLQNRAASPRMSGQSPPFHQTNRVSSGTMCRQRVCTQN